MISEEEKKNLNRAIQKAEKIEKRIAIAKNSSANRLHDCNGFCIVCPQHTTVVDNETLKIVACTIIANEITIPKLLGRGIRIKK